MKKAILFAAVFLIGVSAIAQTSMLSSFNLASDTVVNAATGYLQSQMKGSQESVAVQVVATKISGTVAGTLSLLVSLDGVNFKAAQLSEVATAVNTYTATDVASQTFIWRITGNPYLWYRISWAGTGTMSASFTGKILGRESK